jgi:hypothetical protein
MDPSQKYNGPNLDAFGRLRTSNPLAQFEYQNQYNKGPLIWSERIAGGGVSTHTPDTSTVNLSTGDTTIGSLVTRQTRSYFRYTPGKSLLVLLTGVIGQSVANVRRRIGYFDDDNGVFFEQSNGTLKLVLRSKATGSIVNTAVEQSAWNLDKMNGLGPSGKTLDITKAQIFIFDIQWLGVGSIRCAVEIGGVTYYVHEFENANLVSHVYMTSANLPIRYEIENTGEAAAIATLSQICSTIVTEQGAIDDKGYYTHGANSGITPTSVTTRRSVIAIRPKLQINSLTNRSKIEIEDFSLIVGGNNVLWELVYGCTLGGTPSWVSIGDNSAVERDIAGTTVTGGEVIASGYTSTGSGNARNIASKEISNLYPLALGIEGTDQPILALVCTAFTGTATVNGAINVREFY